ncbi:MAG: lipase family protein [Pseudomonadota bacterium]
MAELSPRDAAQLAERIYDVQNASLVDTFLKQSYFKHPKSSGSAPNRHLHAEVGGRIILNHRDGFGVCAQGKDLNDLFLIFRGTTMANGGADILTDARIGIRSSAAGPVHIGFSHCFKSMLPEIRTFLAAHVNGKKTVHCIGHSLGGAIASLAADWVARNTIHTAKLYTFGAPRVGTEWFAKSTTSAIGRENIHRVYHRTDPVPMVPLYPFMHAPYGQEGHYVFSAEPLTSGEAHKMAKYTKSMEAMTWGNLSGVPENPYTIESAIESWLKSRSPVDTRSATFWRWVDSALIYVLKKVAMTAMVSLQGAFLSTFTIADKIAYILAKGIHLAEKVSIWVEHLMRKLMEALGMKLARSKEELTRSLIRTVLTRVAEKSNREARNALRQL